MKMIRAAMVALPILAAAGSSQAATRIGPQETVILDDTLSISPTNGGFNPNAFAFEIMGEVELGSNPCRARNVEAQLVQRRRGTTIVVIPMLMYPADFQRRICTLEYNPVRVGVKTRVHGMYPTTTEVRVKNVGEMGREVSQHMRGYFHRNKAAGVLK